MTFFLSVSGISPAILIFIYISTIDSRLLGLLSTKRGLFMDKGLKIWTLSTKRAVSMDRTDHQAIAAPIKGYNKKTSLRKPEGKH